MSRLKRGGVIRFNRWNYIPSPKYINELATCYEFGSMEEAFIFGFLVDIYFQQKRGLSEISKNQ